MKQESIEYTVQIWKEGESFIAHAMPLDVMSSGGTPDEARKALHEAVELFLSTSAQMGTLKEVLLECGYERTNRHWTSPDWVAVERQAAVVGD